MLPENIGVMVHKKLARIIAVGVTATAMTALGSLVVAPASAAAAPVADARIAVQFDHARGQLPENIVLEPDGTAVVTLAAARQVAAVSPAGDTRVLATLPAPADGGINTPALGFALTTGIARSQDGTLYVLYATGTADLTGVWRLRPGGTPQRIAALPADGLPNGMALDERKGVLYIADSVLGTIFAVPAAGGTPTVWSNAPALARTAFLGVNGVRLRHGALWATNLDHGTLLRIPLRGDRPGPIQVRAEGLAGIDDFAFTGRGGDIIAALVTANTVVRIRPDGTTTTVLTAADGLQNPTSVAVRGETVYVTNAAYLTATDPNLLLARLQRCP